MLPFLVLLLRRFLLLPISGSLSLSLSLSLTLPGLPAAGFARRAPHSKVKHVSRWARSLTRRCCARTAGCAALRPHRRLCSAAQSRDYGTGAQPNRSRAARASRHVSSMVLAKRRWKACTRFSGAPASISHRPQRRLRTCFCFSSSTRLACPCLASARSSACFLVSASLARSSACLASSRSSNSFMHSIMSCLMSCSLRRFRSYRSLLLQLLRLRRQFEHHSEHAEHTPNTC